MSEQPAESSSPANSEPDLPALEQTGAAAESAATESDASTDASQAAAPPSKAARVRRGVLIVCLLMMIGMAAYDRLVARPAVAAAQQTLQDAAQAQVSKAGRQMDEATVREKLGRQPNETHSGDAYFVERYAWRAGLPWRTYDLWVIYTQFQGRKSFYNSQLYQRPEDRYFPGWKAPPLPKVDLPPDPQPIQQGNFQSPKPTGKKPGAKDEGKKEGGKKEAGKSGEGG